MLAYRSLENVVKVIQLDVAVDPKAAPDHRPDIDQIQSQDDFLGNHGFGLATRGASKDANLRSTGLRGEHSYMIRKIFGLQVRADVGTGQMAVRGIEIPGVTEEEPQSLDDLPKDTEDSIEYEGVVEIAL